MVLEVDAEVTLDVDAAAKVNQAHRARLEDALDRGFAESQDRVPVSSGSLLQSGYPPEWDGDTLRYGYRADHAKPVEFGSQPHWPPIAPLKKWARRVLGDESAAYAVQQKIAEKGTPAQKFARPGRDMAKRYLAGHPLGEYLDL